MPENEIVVRREWLVLVGVVGLVLGVLLASGALNRRPSLPADIRPGQHTAEEAGSGTRAPF